MPLKLETLADLSALDADDIIDVRAPSEFAEDHIPGAINLPALSDAERAQVGTIYVQDSPFKARKIGAALVARNVATHLETELAERPGRLETRGLLLARRSALGARSCRSCLRSAGAPNSWKTDTNPIVVW